MTKFDDFVASRVSGTDDDPLLEKHPHNPALEHIGTVAYLSDTPPIRQHLYKYSDDRYYLIAEQHHWKTGKTIYAFWWGQGGDDYRDTLEEAEKGCFELIENDS